MAADKRIPELPLIGLISTNMAFAIYDPVTDTTYHILASTVLPSAVANTYTWDPDVDYDVDEIVTYSQGPGQAPEVWISIDTPNEGNIPGPGSLFWTIGVQQTGSALKYWAPGVYSQDDVYVTYVIGDQLGLYRLIYPTRPFNSVDFLVELAGGYWRKFGAKEVAVFDTTLLSDIITIDFKKLEAIDFRESAAIAEPKTWVFSNPVEGTKSNIRFSMTGGFAQQLPLNTKIAGSDNAIWDSALKQWTAIMTGEYELVVTYMFNQYNGVILGPFS